MGFYSRALLVFLMKESKKRRRKQPGKLMAKSRSQPVNLPGAWPLMNPLRRQQERHQTKGLMKRTVAVHVCYQSLCISLPSSAKQQHEITKFCIVYCGRQWLIFRISIWNLTPSLHI